MRFCAPRHCGSSEMVARILLLTALFPTPALSQSQPSFELSSDSVLADEVVTITLSGVPPGEPVTVRLELHDTRGLWRSHATFVADGTGRVDLEQMAPVSGSYSGVAPMGLVWSVERDEAVEPQPASPSGNPPPVPIDLAAEVDGEIVATATFSRRAVALDVRVTEVREAGLVATFYQPPGDGPHPGMLVFGGSGGGVLGPWSYPGGIASWGYAVLALGYFGTDGRPPTLSRIPLEYFKTGLDWLGDHEAVDANRVGVFGGSRGAEVALLLGATYPGVKAIVALAPSHVVWAGCCDEAAFASPAWTYGGEPIPRVESEATPEDAARQADGLEPQLVHRFLALLENATDLERAIIPVERINGPVLLISGRDDYVWPSTLMADRIVARLERHGFRHPVAHVAYDNAGHAITRPFPSMVHTMGGTPEGNARAWVAHWRTMQEFLEANLR